MAAKELPIALASLIVLFLLLFVWMLILFSLVCFLRNVEDSGVLY